MYMTKHLEASSSGGDRPAFEVTDKMIEAGIAAIRDVWGYNVPDREDALVRAVYLAMSRVLTNVDAAPSTSKPAER